MTVREGYGQTETTLQIGCFPGEPVKPGSMGQETPGYRIRLLDAEDQEAEEGEVCIALDPAPVGLMRGYQNDDGSFAPLGTSGVSHRRCRRRAMRTAITPMSAAPTTCSKHRTTGSARSNWKAR